MTSRRRGGSHKTVLQLVGRASANSSGRSILARLKN
jgi:hypothetical protein